MTDKLTQFVRAERFDQLSGKHVPQFKNSLPTRIGNVFSVTSTGNVLVSSAVVSAGEVWSGYQLVADSDTNIRLAVCVDNTTVSFVRLQATAPSVTILGDPFDSPVLSVVTSATHTISLILYSLTSTGQTGSAFLYLSRESATPFADEHAQ